MRYWILTTEYPPQYGGGIGTYVYYTARMLRDKGHAVTVFLYDITINEEKITENEGIRLIRFGSSKKEIHQFLGFNASVSYEYATIIGKYLINEQQPDIIESQEYQAIAYYVQQFKWLGYENFRDLNILITCHAPSFLCLEYNHVPIYQLPMYWTGQMEKASIKAADILISPSRYFVQQARQRMQWLDIDEEYIVNPIQIEPGVQKAPYIQNRIICFGKLSPLKGTFELLTYFKKLWDSGFPYPLTIIGGTQQVFHPEGETMETLVNKKYGVYIQNNLLILEGELPPAQAKEKILSANIVLVPSTFDNLPYTVLEAMSWGKIVLASRQGGQTEIISHGVNGFLFDHFIEGDFEEKILSVMQMDTVELKRVAQNAIDTINGSYSPEIVYPQKMAVIKKFFEEKKLKRMFPFIEQIDCPIELATDDKTGELLSIVIPYYNMGDYIEDCIRSLIDSEYADKEIIIVNDGSTDEKSIATLNELQRKYPVTIYHKSNEGLPTTRNFGAAKASGKYLAFLDADDIVDKTYYRKAINVLSTNINVHFVGCWVKYFGESKNCWPAFNPEPPYLLIHNMVNSSALVYKKSSFMLAGLNDKDFIYGMEDWNSVISMVENGFGGVVLPELLFNYRIRKDSMARAFTQVKRLFLYKLIADKHKSFFARYANEISHLLNANGPGMNLDNPTFEPPILPGVSLRLSGRTKELLKRRIKGNKYLRKAAYAIYKRIKK